MKLVVIESPYAGEVEENISYARLCMVDSLERGEAPLASHLLYTQKGILDDKIPDQRLLGIEAGYAWMRRAADLVAVYIDRGISPGMEKAIEYAKARHIPIEIRYIEPRDKDLA